MELIQFTDSDGKLIAAINPEQIISVIPSSEGQVKISTQNGDFDVPHEQFEKKCQHSEDELSRLNMNITRLITALERLSIHIPTSIRMHL